MKKSWIHPEKQLLLKFLDMQGVYSEQAAASSDSENFYDLVHAEIQVLRKSGHISGSVVQMAFERNYMDQAAILTGSVTRIDVEEKVCHKVVQPLREKCFLDTELEMLSEVYKTIFPNKSVHVSRFYEQFKTLVLNGEEFISLSSRSQRSAAIIAHWPSAIGRIDAMGMGTSRIGLIENFIRHKLKLDDLHVNCLLARVKWFEEHPMRNHFHKTIIVCGRLFIAESCSMFIPVARIMGRCTIVQTTFLFNYGEDHITIAIPCV